MKISDLKNKTVITVPGGDIIGTVTDVLLHSAEQRVGALVVKSDAFAGLQIVLSRDIGSIAGNAVTIAGADKLHDQTRFGASHQMLSGAKTVGLQVATVSGDYVGRLSDIYVDNVSSKIMGFEVTGGLFARMFGRTHTIEASEQTHLGKDLLIVADEALPKQVVAEEAK
jgi:uncharacterized protein YrrD